MSRTKNYKNRLIFYGVIEIIKWSLGTFLRHGVHVVKLFQPSSSFLSPPPLQNSKRKPQRCQWVQEVWKIVFFFSRNSPLSQKRYDIAPLLLCAANRKS